MTQSSNVPEGPDNTSQNQQQLFSFESPTDALPDLMVRLGTQMEKMPDRIKSRIHTVREWFAHVL
jgi:deoxyadenosine/deoxycytidine kinase